MKKVAFAALCAAFGILHTLLFYKQQWGINLLLFETPLFLLLYAYNKPLFSNRTPLLLLAGCFLSMLAVLVTHSSLSCFVHTLFFVLLSGATLQPISNPAAYFVSALEKIPEILLLPFSKQKTTTVADKSYRTTFVLRATIVPLLIIVVFVYFYSLAVPRFDRLLGDFFQLFPQLNFTTVWLFISGTVLTVFVLRVSKSNTVSNFDAVQPDTLQRTKGFNKFRTLTLGLKKEHLSMLILLVGLNLLIAIINGLDIASYWFSYSPVSYEDMKILVHEGTYLLIFCIMLSVGVVLYAFRKNLNFYPNNKTIRYLGIAWMVQNGIMVLSVAWRNYWYIQSYNLAYKRIAVLVFLAATLFGIATVIFKIQQRKTGYHLLKLNSSFVLVLLAALAFVNWDLLITRYNLTHKDTAYIHKNYLADMSNAALPVLLEYQDVFDSPIEKQMSYNHLYRQYGDSGTYKRIIDAKAQKFMAQYENRHWLSYNISDARTAEYLKQQGY